MSTINVLVVEDEEAILTLIQFTLEQAGFNVTGCTSVEAAKPHLLEKLPDVVLLDWMLPGTSGIQLTKQLRQDQRTKDLPIILLTARSDDVDKEMGLNLGADDYLTKPFLMDEVVLRLRAMLRRTAGAASAVLRVGQLEYDVVHGRFNLQGQGLQHTAQEHKILAFFMHHPGKLLTRSEISENVYARDLDPDSNTLDVLIGRIRRKLGQPQLLVTERGQGFRLHSAPPADDRP